MLHFLAPSKQCMTVHCTKAVVVQCMTSFLVPLMAVQIPRNEDFAHADTSSLHAFLNRHF